jgi:hypothetical protein
MLSAEEHVVASLAGLANRQAQIHANRHTYSSVCLQAERKGATATEYGLVFGIFELVVFFISPIYGQHVSRLHCTAPHLVPHKHDS